MFFYGAKLLQWQAVEAMKWDTTTTRSHDGKVITTRRNRETGQTLTWEEVERDMRRHIVTGGLTIEARRQLFEEHKERLGQVG